MLCSGLLCDCGQATDPLWASLVLSTRKKGLWGLNTIVYHEDTIQPGQGTSPECEFGPNSKLL